MKVSLYQPGVSVSMFLTETETVDQLYTKIGELWYSVMGGVLTHIADEDRKEELERYYRASLRNFTEI